MKMSVLLSAMLSLAVSAAMAAPVQPTYTLPNSNPAPYQSLDNYGYNTYHVESSTGTSAVLVGAGSGLLYGVVCSSGATGEYGIAFDSASASGVTNATQGEALSPWVYVAVTATSTVPAGSVVGQWTAPRGSARFTNGLVFVKSGQYDACLVQALFDANVNSSSH